jgi:hypothetical protein
MGKQEGPVSEAPGKSHSKIPGTIQKVHLSFLYLQRSSIESRDLGGHQAVFGLISVRSSIRFGKKRSISAPLDVHYVTHDEGVFRSYFEAARAAFRGRFDYLGKHFTQGPATSHYITVRCEKFNIVRKLSHQAVPIACVEGGEVFRNHFFRRCLRDSFWHRPGLGGGGINSCNRREQDKQTGTKIKKIHEANYAITDVGLVPAGVRMPATAHVVR